MAKLRTSSLKIGRVINERLKGLLTVYPIIADKGAQYPFGIYKRNSLQTDNTKDMYNYSELANVEITIAATTYNESVQLAQEVKVRLEQLKGKFETATEDAITLNDCTMINASEDFIDDAYIQKLTFEFDICNFVR